MQEELADNSLERSESSEHNVEEWLLVDKNVAEFEADHIGEHSTVSSLKVQTTTRKQASAIKKPKLQKIDATLVLNLAVGEKHSNHLAQDSSKMPTPDEKTEEALKTQTYDAIEDSIYNELDKDTSTGSGRRVHTGNFRMKQSSGKATTKDANVSSSTATTDPKQ